MKRFYSKPVLVLLELLVIAAVSLWYYAPRFISDGPRPIASPIPAGQRDFSDHSICVYTSLEQVQAAYPDTKLTMSRQVDFTRDKLVRVSWNSTGYGTDEMVAAGWPDGPLFGRLAYVQRQGGGIVRFYVAEPISSGRMHQVFSQIVGDDWFVLPRRARIGYGASPEGLLSDATFAVLIFAAASLILATWQADDAPAVQD